MTNLKLNDIISEDFQLEIQNSFSVATGFGVVFTDAQGNHVGSQNTLCKFCAKINQSEIGSYYCSCTNKKAISIALETQKPSIYICHAGLVNIEIPIIYKGECVGAITAGNILCLEPNEYPQDKSPDSINWLEDEELTSYYKEIRVATTEQINATTSTLSTITNYIIQNFAYTQAQKELTNRTNELLKAQLDQNKLEKNLKLAQLDALQKQVTPHFIFNVVNSISRLLTLGEYQTAQNMLDSFAQMMRYTLSNAKDLITLEQEINYIKNYLTIQKIRFTDRIHYEIKCNPKLHSILIPFFSIQPLVENAIKHGLLDKEQGGKIVISISGTPNNFLIQIMDNGKGIPTDLLQPLIQSLQSPDPPSNQEHIGLYNCYHRLYLMFGNNMDFVFKSKPNKGTLVSITIWKNA